mgnify:FL=1|jgi:hypothetical protein|tara:strand:- start:10 stop:2223 length:2214 start_codon:yes stop_codon:yes gene_type:complete
MPRSAEQQELYDKLKLFLDKYRGKTLSSDVLAAKVAEIYKGKLGNKTPAGKWSDLKRSNPELFKNVNIVSNVKGKLDRYYNANPEFQKFYKERYESKNGKWEDISVADRTVKKNSIKTFKLDLERKKTIPNNYIRNNLFSEKVGINPDTFRTMRTRDDYKTLINKINKIAKPKKFNKELYFKDPSADEISKIKNLIKENREIGVKSMAEKKQAVSYEPIRAIHRELIRDPDATPTELAEAIYGKANAKNLRNIGNDASMYVEFLSGSRKVPGITAPTVMMSENILGNILMPGSGFFNFGNAERRNAMLKERDKILKITDPNNRLFTIRNRLLRNLRGQGFNVDEAMGLSATYERAPGYSELAQITSPEVNYIKGNTIDRDFSRIFDKVVRGEQNLGSEIKKFNQDSKAFQKTYNVDTPIIEYKPGEKLDASKFVKNFDKLTPEAQANVSQLADQGIALRSKAMPMGALLAAVEKAPQACRTILNYQTGGISATCAEAIQKDPVGSAEKLKNLDAQSGPLAKVKNAAVSFLKSPGVKRFGIAGVAGTVGAAIVKEFNNNDPTTYLSNEDQQKSLLVSMALDPVAPDFERPDILDYQLPAVGATIAGATAVSAPTTIKASRSRALGVEQKGLTRTAGRVLGRGLGVAASPGLLAPLAAMDITSQIAEGDSPMDIATDPLNYLYPAFADQTPKLTRGLNPLFRKAANLGLGKVGLRALSRAGIVGLAASLGIQGYNLLDD